jgi:hypothetical protein
MLLYPEDFTNAAWAKSTGGAASNPIVTGNAGLAPDGTMTADRVQLALNGGTTLTDFPQLTQVGLTFLAGVTYTVSHYVKAFDAGAVGKIIAFRGAAGTSPKLVALTADWQRVSNAEVGNAAVTSSSIYIRGAQGTSDSADFLLWGSQINMGATAGVYTPGNTAVYNPIAPIADRSAATGTSIKVGIDGYGKLAATAFDGTSTRTVTTPAAYNTGVFTKVRATYQTTGKLGITVNGVEVASATGTPLLTMNSRRNLLTKTEDFADAAWVKTNGATGSGSTFTLVGSASYVRQTVALPTNAKCVLRLTISSNVATTLLVGLVDFADGSDVKEQTISVTTVPTEYTIQCDFSASSTFSGNAGLGFNRAGLANPVGSTFTVEKLQLEYGGTPTTYQRVNTATDFDFAAPLTIGNSRTLDAPFPGSITMLKIGATVPTPEQALWMYEQEKQMFRADAQICLPSSTAVLDLTYDESRDRWTALQAGNESSFTGLVRTSTAAVSAGSFSKVDAKGGVKLLARTTTNPGVDVTVPAMGLKEELVRRAEAAAKAAKLPITFPFDAISAQTDFVLPVGYITSSVMLGGTRKREGATKDYVLLFDGFRETVRFAVAPGAAAWVEINARKE